MDTGGKVAIIIGSVLLFIILLILLFNLKKKKKKPNNTKIEVGNITFELNKEHEEQEKNKQPVKKKAIKVIKKNNLKPIAKKRQNKFLPIAKKNGYNFKPINYDFNIKPVQPIKPVQQQTTNMENNEMSNNHPEPNNIIHNNGNMAPKVDENGNLIPMQANNYDDIEYEYDNNNNNNHNNGKDNIWVYLDDIIEHIKKYKQSVYDMENEMQRVHTFTNQDADSVHTLERIEKLSQEVKQQARFFQSLTPDKEVNEFLLKHNYKGLSAKVENGNYAYHFEDASKKDETFRIDHFGTIADADFDVRIGKKGKPSLRCIFFDKNNTDEPFRLVSSVRQVQMQGKKFVNNKPEQKLKNTYMIYQEDKGLNKNGFHTTPLKIMVDTDCYKNNLNLQNIKYNVFFLDPNNKCKMMKINTQDENNYKKAWKSDKDKIDNKNIDLLPLGCFGWLDESKGKLVTDIIEIEVCSVIHHLSGYDYIYFDPVEKQTCCDFLKKEKAEECRQKFLQRIPHLSLNDIYTIVDKRNKKQICNVLQSSHNAEKVHKALDEQGIGNLISLQEIKDCIKAKQKH